MGASRLKSGFAILLVGDALGKLVSFVVFSRLARVLELDAYGRLELVMAVVVLGALVIEAGLSPFGARSVARDPVDAPRILGRVLALRALILAGVLVVLAACAAVLGSDGGGPLLLLALVILVPKAFLCEWLFQGRREMATVTMTMLVEPLVALAGTIAFVDAPEHLWRAPLVLAAAVAAVAIVQHVVARARGVVADVRHGFASAGATLRASLPLGASALAWAVRFYAPMIALGIAATPAEAGTFGAAHRLVVSIHAVVWLWFFNLLPTWSQAALTPGLLERQMARSLKASAVLGALLAAAVAANALFITAPFLYGEGYAASVPVLRVLGLVPALAWISGNFRFGMIARGALAGDFAANASGAAAAVIAFLVIGRGVTAVSGAWIFCGAEAVTLAVAWLLWRRGDGAAATPPPPRAALP